MGKESKNKVKLVDPNNESLEGLDKKSKARQIAELLVSNLKKK